MKNIQRYFNVIDNGLFNTSGLDYDRITDAIIALANAVADYDGDTEAMWYIGECEGSTMMCLSDLIVGAYWHYAEWHAGQWSKGYQALSALGRVFDPGMSSAETDNEAYSALESIAA